MTLIFPFLLLIVFAAVVAFTFSEGLWANAIRLINVVMAALLAFNFWEPLARLVEGFGDLFVSMSYFLDFMCLWLIFAAAMMFFNAATRAASQVKVKFLKVVDQSGSVALSVIIGWVMVCFVTATMHTAPIGVTAFGGGFDPDKKMFFGALAPDIQWLAFMNHVSRGSFSRTLSDEDAQSGVYGQGNSQLAVFDQPRTSLGMQFRGIYTLRRIVLQVESQKNNSFRVSADKAGKR